MEFNTRNIKKYENEWDGNSLVFVNCKRDRAREWWEQERELCTVFMYSIDVIYSLVFMCKCERGKARAQQILLLGIKMFFFCCSSHSYETVRYEMEWYKQPLNRPLAVEWCWNQANKNTQVMHEWKRNMQEWKRKEEHDEAKKPILCSLEALKLHNIHNNKPSSTQP